MIYLENDGFFRVVRTLETGFSGRFYLSVTNWLQSSARRGFGDVRDRKQRAFQKNKNGT
jgi:hypothetical protein